MEEAADTAAAFPLCQLPLRMEDVESSGGSAAPFSLRVLCPEYIVFAVDTSAEMQRVDLAAPMTRLAFVREQLAVFTKIKHTINPAHYFALVTFDAASGEPVWSGEFTNDPDVLLACFDAVVASAAGDAKAHDVQLDKTFRLVGTKVRMPAVGDDGGLQYVVRLVLVYGRSDAAPQLAAGVPKPLADCPGLYFDAVYLHEPTPAKCQEIFDAIVSVEDHLSTSAYLFEAGRRVQKAVKGFATLVAHPLVRSGDQSDFASGRLG